MLLFPENDVFTNVLPVNSTFNAVFKLHGVFSKKFINLSYASTENTT